MRFSILPTLLIVTSVSAVSLSDISPLPSNTVTPGCESAYGEQIPACPFDLRTSKICSAECSSALDELAKKVIVACRQAFVGPDSLLRRVLDGGIQNTLCGATVSASGSPTSSTDSTSVTAVVTITPTTSTSAPTLAKSSTKSATTTRAPSFSGAMTFSTVERPTGSSGLPGLLTLDNAPIPTVSPETTDSDSSFAQILYNPNSTSTTESPRIAPTSTTSSSGSGDGSPFGASGTNSAPSSSINVQKGAWAVFALLAAFLSL